MKPRVLLHGGPGRQQPHAQGKFSPLSFKHILFSDESLLRARQQLCVIVDEPGGDIAVGLCSELQEHSLLLVDVYSQQRPHLGFVFGRQNGLKQGVFLRFLLFFAETYVAAYEHDYRNNATSYHDRYTPFVHQAHHYSGSYECHSGSDEPSSYH